MAAVATRGTSWSKKDTYLASGAAQGRGLGLVPGADDSHAAVASGAGVACIGVQEEPSINAGDPISVIEMGDAVAIAGGAITVGAYVKVTAAGRFIVVTGTAGGGENIVGRAKTAAAASGDEFVLLVLPSVL